MKNSILFTIALSLTLTFSLTLPTSAQTHTRESLKNELQSVRTQLNNVLNPNNQYAEEELRNQIKSLKSKIKRVQILSLSITDDLYLNSEGEYVRSLQQFLNDQGYLVSNEGPGSPGQETTYFGEKTKQALANFQRDNNILPSEGYFGQITKNTIVNMYTSPKPEVLGESSGGPTISATISRTSCVAPCGILGDAVGTNSNITDEPFHELYYEWDFGYPSASFVNRPDVNPNNPKGPIAAFVYDTPGNYDVELEVTDWDGNSSVKQFEVEVLDPEVVYDGNTYCVSPSGDFSDCPTQDSDFHSTNLSEVIEIVIPRDAVGPGRILLKKGEEHIIQCATHRPRDITGPFLISSYGSGSMPFVKKGNCTPSDGDVVNGGNFFNFLSASDVAVMGIEFWSSYDATTGYGDRYGVFDNEGATNNITVYRNKMSGFGLTIRNHENVSNMFFVDNEIRNWQDYGFYGGLKNGAILGNIIKQKENAWNAPGGRTCRADESIEPCPAAHSPVRIPSPEKVVISYNDMFNNAGWSSDGRAHGANLRLIVDGRGNFSVVSENKFEGGFGVISLDAQQRTLDVNPSDRLIFERNLVVATTNTQSMISVRPPGKIIRNNILLKKNDGHQFPDHNGGLGYSQFSVGIGISSPWAPALAEEPIWVYGNTFAVLEEERAGIVRFFQIEGDYEYEDVNTTANKNIKILNNLLYAPHLDQTQETSSAGPLGGLIAWFRDDTELVSNNNLIYSPDHSYFSNSRINLNNGYGGYSGLREGHTLEEWQDLGFDLNSFESDPLFINENSFNFKLSSNSPALGLASEVPGWFEDFQGNPRPQGSGYDIGAYESSSGSGGQQQNTRPTVTTSSAGSITTTGATLNGSVSSTGGATVTERGFVWGTSSHSSNPGNVAPNQTSYTNTETESGSFSTGSFNDAITSLTSNTTYYFRAYARNSEGYSYGSQTSFTTEEEEDDDNQNQGGGDDSGSNSGGGSGGGSDSSSGGGGGGSSSGGNDSSSNNSGGGGGGGGSSDGGDSNSGNTNTPTNPISTNTTELEQLKSQLVALMLQLIALLQEKLATLLSGGV